MEFFEVINKRRTIRRFTADAVNEDDLLAMLEAARLAPSSHNQQPWHFIVIRDKNLMEELRSIVDAIFDQHIATANTEEQKTLLSGRRFHATHVFDAPVVIVALGQSLPNLSPGEQPIFNQRLQSVAAAIAQLNLTATALGYGGCWATLPLEMAQAEIEGVLGIEKPWFAAAVISIGVPARTPREIVRKSIEEIATFK